MGIFVVVFVVFVVVVFLGFVLGDGVVGFVFGCFGELYFFVGVCGLFGWKVGLLYCV